ncbi:glycosyltransferase [uncultured Marinobacter sp.]|uniref:glycosyltransferase n=1 Tax=uncultured Marinobacter sp. TaxID=187379 RepID=UPI0032B21EFE
MRVLHIAYQQLRRYGKTRVSWAQKLSYGLIKNDHYVLDFSDRDIAAFEAPFGIRDLGHKKANKRLLETVEAAEPDLIIIGHGNIITNETLAEIKKRNPNAVLVHCNLDPLFVPENDAKIRYRAEVCEAVFVSTGRKELERFKDTGVRLYHIPNPVDPSIEVYDNSQRTDLPVDLVFCSNSNDYTRRQEIVEEVKMRLGNELVFKAHGSFGTPPVWGRDYDKALSQSRMALNLNRQEGDYWYSSERMAQLAGNGILPFTHEAARFDELLPPETLVYFSDTDDLINKIREFHHDDAKRRHWAARAREFFHREMNTRLFSQYIVEASLMQPFSHDYVWARDINLDGSMK